MNLMHTNKMSMKIMLVDDDSSSTLLQQQALDNAGYSEYICNEGSKVIDCINEHQPDVLIIDYHLQEERVGSIIRQIRQTESPQNPLPILVISSDTSVRHKAYAFGANDFLPKPLDIHEFVLKVDAMLELRLLHGEVVTQNELLDADLAQRNLELKSALEQLEELHATSLGMIGLLLEMRDLETSGHTKRVVTMSQKLGQKMKLDQDILDQLQQGALLHDIGKLAIPDAVLMKPGKLDEAEWKIMRSHTLKGFKMLQSLNFLPERTLTVVRSHHEKWSGRGYPDGLKGEEIPILARIFTITDVYDALTSPRVYKNAWSKEAALFEIGDMAGDAFDPDIADIFIEMMNPGQGLGGSGIF